MKKFSLLFFLLLSWLFIFKPPVFAADEFITSYDVTYEAFESSTMQVTQNISLTNKLSNVYVTSYSLIFEGKGIKNIKAYDAKGEIDVAVTEEVGKTTVYLGLKEKVVGKGKTLNFTVFYQNDDLVQQAGRIWETVVPRLASPQDIENYELTLVVPLSFGKPAFVSPQPVSSSQDSQKRYLKFSKKQIASSGVVGAFGEFQIFDFDLAYHLENNKLYPVKTEIALPPDTNYQQVSYTQISPEPKNVKVDVDGNFMAEYNLSPGEKLEIHARGQVKIFSREKGHFRQENLDSYLVGQEFWGQTEKIKEIAQDLKTPQNIYQYVVKTLDYDYSRVREGAKRLGAENVLRTPERAICTEYTDLFIALSRAAGIPAREINGYAYTTNPILQPLSLAQDVLHSWPQYWDREQKSWIQVDPTWQDTTGGVDYFQKLDLGHFTFAIHGQDSTYPPPAGSYKLPGEARKDVVIAFGQYKDSKKEFILKKNFPDEILAERKVAGSITVVNSGNQTIYDLPVKIKVENVSLLSGGEAKIETIPPFGKIEIPLSFKATTFSLQEQGIITVFAGDRKFEYNIKINSFILGLLLPVLAVVSLLLLIYYGSGKIKVYIKRKQNENLFPKI